MAEMKAAERMLALLDERGVEYEVECIDFSNYFTWGENDCYSYTEYPDGTVLRIWDCTPEQAIAATLGESDEGCYLMRDGKKFPVELDYGFIGILPITINVAGFRYLLEVPNGE